MFDMEHINEFDTYAQAKLIEETSIVVGWETAYKAVRTYPDEQRNLMLAFPGFLYIGSRIIKLASEISKGFKHNEDIWDYSPGRDTDIWTTSINLNLLPKRLFKHLDTKTKPRTFTSPTAVVSVKTRRRNHRIDAIVDRGKPNIHPVFQWALERAIRCDYSNTLCAIPLKEGGVQLVDLRRFIQPTLNKNIQMIYGTTLNTPIEVREAILSFIALSNRTTSIHEIATTINPDIGLDKAQFVSLATLLRSKLRTRNFLPEILMYHLAVSGIAQTLAIGFCENHLWSAGTDLYYLFLRLVERTQCGNWGLESINPDLRVIYEKCYFGRKYTVGKLRNFLVEFSKTKPETFKSLVLIDRSNREYNLGFVMSDLDRRAHRTSEAYYHRMFRDSRLLPPEQWMGYYL